MASEKDSEFFERDVREGKKIVFSTSIGLNRKRWIWIINEKDLMESIQDTKEASCKSIEDQGISVIALMIAETLDTVLEHRELPVRGFDDKAKSLS